MERQIPKNVRQIGNVSDSPRIYVEDYVDTFFAQMCEKYGKSSEKTPTGAFLIGDIQQTDGEDYVYIYGAVRMRELKMSGNEYVLDEETWKQAYEDCKQFFEDGELLGWFVVHPGGPLIPDASTVRLHRKSFPKKNTIFIMKDPVEKDETYFAYKMNDLMAIGGHYTYYEKNPCMQNYMIANRKKNGLHSAETVEDRAAQDFRNMVRKRGERKKGRKTGGMMYAVSACLVLVLIIMGVSMLNSFDRMKSVQSTLETLADTSGAGKTMETSGSVTAVTSGGQDDQGKSGMPDGQDAGQDEAADGQGVQPGTADGTEGVQTGTADRTDGGQASGEGSGDAGRSGTDASSGTASSAGAGSAGSAGAASSGTNGSDGVYTVEEGDTLAIISQKMYGDVTHVDAICRMNGISDGNLIYVGQKLLLP